MAQENNEINYFDQLNRVKVKDLALEKEGTGGKTFSYLPWAIAIEETCSRFPDTTWQVLQFDQLYEIGQAPHLAVGHRSVPYQQTPAGVFVHTTVTVQGICKPMWLPVLDNRNKPVLDANAVQINKTLMRCLVKNFAAHGMGLDLYKKEDNSPSDDDNYKMSKTVLTRAEQTALDTEADLERLKKAAVDKVVKAAKTSGVSNREVAEIIARQFSKSSASELDLQQLSNLAILVANHAED